MSNRRIENTIQSGVEPPHSKIKPNLLRLTKTALSTVSVTNCEREW